jgi:hypothetical protein
MKSEGDIWARQRRLIAPHLNERISSVTWIESCIQSRQMVAYLLDQKNGETGETLDGLKSVAIGVLGQAGYGQQKQWDVGNRYANGTFDNTSEDEQNALFNAISLMIENLLPCALIPARILQLPFMPKVFKLLGKTKENFPMYSEQMLESERKLSAGTAEPRQNMAAMLVHLADGGVDGGAKGKPSLSSKYLTQEEINGNLFAFTSAGFDTTASAMGYAIFLLAAYPKWQKWIQDELDTVFTGVSWEEDGDYAAVYPQLQRCLAVMVCILHPHQHTFRVTNLLHFSVRNTATFSTTWPHYSQHDTCATC